MKVVGNSILLNDVLYRVKSIEEKNHSRIRKGAFERYLKGQRGFAWTVDYKYFYVTAKSRMENFERIFVFEEQEFKQLI